MIKARTRGLAVAGALSLAVVTSGCGLGSGESSAGEATLAVTRDYGSERLLEATEAEPSQSETVIRMLDREAEITTRYSGAFVHSIDGIAGEIAEGRSYDWFFFLNGIESSIGAAEAEVSGGDHVWWDYRDWTDALRTPAVVGSWPEPFLQASAGSDRVPVRIECFGRRDPCDRVRDRLAEEGVEASVGRAASAGPPSLRLLVGPWAEVRADPLAEGLEQGPAVSGVFARIAEQDGAWSLEALDQRATVVQEYGPGTGLVAGMREAEQPASWLVTGVDAAGVDEAVAMLDAEHLVDRYAVAVTGGRDLGVPVGGGE